MGWIAKQKLPHDVDQAIMFGLKRIRPVLRGEARVGGSAPYGIIWYGINLPMARFVGYDGRKWMLLLALVDSVFIWLSQAMGLLMFTAYILIGTFQLFRAPWNVSIDWIIILGLFYWWLLLIAPIAKLPVGLPLATFGDTKRGLFYQHNYVYYGLLGTLWLIVFVASFMPDITETVTVLFGVIWLVLLGYLYFRRLKVNAKKSPGSASN
jgi:hypothetical protein